MQNQTNSSHTVSHKYRQKKAQKNQKRISAWSLILFGLSLLIFLLLAIAKVNYWWLVGIVAVSLLGIRIFKAEYFKGAYKDKWPTNLAIAIALC